MPLRPWSAIAPEVSRLSPEQQDEVRQAYLDEVRANPKEAPQDPSGLMAPKAVAVGAMTGKLQPHPETGELATETERGLRKRTDVLGAIRQGASEGLVGRLSGMEQDREYEPVAGAGGILESIARGVGRVASDAPTMAAAPIPYVGLPIAMAGTDLAHSYLDEQERRAEAESRGQDPGPTPWGEYGKRALTSGALGLAAGGAGMLARGAAPTVGKALAPVAEAEVMGGGEALLHGADPGEAVATNLGVLGGIRAGEAGVRRAMRKTPLGAPDTDTGVNDGPDPGPPDPGQRTLFADETPAVAESPEGLVSPQQAQPKPVRERLPIPSRSANEGALTRPVTEVLVDGVPPAKPVPPDRPGLVTRAAEGVGGVLERVRGRGPVESLRGQDVAGPGWTEGTQADANRARARGPLPEPEAPPEVPFGEALEEIADRLPGGNGAEGPLSPQQALLRDLRQAGRPGGPMERMRQGARAREAAPVAPPAPPGRIGARAYGPQPQRNPEVGPLMSLPRASQERGGDVGPLAFDDPEAGSSPLARITGDVDDAGLGSLYDDAPAASPLTPLRPQPAGDPSFRRRFGLDEGLGGDAAAPVQPPTPGMGYDNPETGAYWRDEALFTQAENPEVFPLARVRGEMPPEPPPAPPAPPDAVPPPIPPPPPPAGAPPGAPPPAPGMPPGPPPLSPAQRAVMGRALAQLERQISTGKDLKGRDLLPAATASLQEQANTYRQRMGIGPASPMVPPVPGQPPGMASGQIPPRDVPIPMPDERPRAARLADAPPPPASGPPIPMPDQSESPPRPGRPPVAAPEAPQGRGAQQAPAGTMTQVRRRLTEDALAEAEERLASGKNAKGEPLRPDILASLQRQRDELRARLGIADEPAPDATPAAPIGKPPVPKTAPPLSNPAKQPTPTVPMADAITPPTKDSIAGLPVTKEGRAAELKRAERALSMLEEFNRPDSPLKADPARVAEMQRYWTERAEYIRRRPQGKVMDPPEGDPTKFYHDPQRELAEIASKREALAKLAADEPFVMPAERHQEWVAWLDAREAAAKSKLTSKPVDEESTYQGEIDVTTVEDEQFGRLVTMWENWEGSEQGTKPIPKTAAGERARKASLERLAEFHETWRDLEKSVGREEAQAVYKRLRARVQEELPDALELMPDPFAPESAESKAWREKVDGLPERRHPNEPPEPEAPPSAPAPKRTPTPQIDLALRVYRGEGRAAAGAPPRDLPTMAELEGPFQEARKRAEFLLNKASEAEAAMKKIPRAHSKKRAEAERVHRAARELYDQHDKATRELTGKWAERKAVDTLDHPEEAVRLEALARLAERTGYYDRAKLLPEITVRLKALVDEAMPEGLPDDVQRRVHEHFDGPSHRWLTVREDRALADQVRTVATNAIRDVLEKAYSRWSLTGAFYKTFKEDVQSRMGEGDPLPRLLAMWAKAEKADKDASAHYIRENDALRAEKEAAIKSLGDEVASDTRERIVQAYNAQAIKDAIENGRESAEKARQERVSAARRGEVRVVPAGSPASKMTKRLYGVLDRIGMTREGDRLAVTPDDAVYLQKQGLWEGPADKGTLTPAGEALRSQLLELQDRRVEFTPPPPGKPPKLVPYKPSEAVQGSRAWKAAGSCASKDTSRISLTGTFYDGENIVSTDGHRLIAVPAKLKIEKGIYAADGSKVDMQFPDYRQVVPSTKNMELAAQVGSTRLKDYGRAPNDSLTDDGIGPVMIVKGPSGEMNLRAEYVAEAADALAKLGVDKVDVWVPKGGGGTAPMVITGAGAGDTGPRVVIMPMSPGEPRSFVRFPGDPKGVTLGMGLGAVGEFGRRKPTVEHTFSDDAVEALFPKEKATPWRDMIERLKGVPEAVRQGFGSVFGFEPTLGDRPQLRNALRKFQDAWTDGEHYANRQLYRVLGGLERKVKGEYEQFRRLAVLEDLVQRAEEGKPPPAGLTLEQAKRAHDELLAKATPEVRHALEEHRAVVRELAEEQVRLGKLPAMVLDKGTYYPHQVLDFADIVAAISPAGGSRSLRSALRPWARKAEGGEGLIDVDYIKVMQDHIRNVQHANALDRFAQEWLPREDVLPTLSPEQRTQLFGTRPDGTPGVPARHGQGVMIDGRKYRAYRYAPFEFREYVPNHPMEAVALRTEVQDTGSGPMHLLPEAVFDRFQRFTERSDYTAIQKLWRRHTVWWKRWLIDGLGLAYHGVNTLGDLLDSVRYSARGTAFSLTHPIEVAKAIRGTHPDARFQEALRTERITEGSTFIGAELPHSELPSHLKGLSRERGQFDLVPRPVRRLAQGREAYLRVGQALWNYRRLQKGQKVWAGGIDITGLDGIEAMGKVAREFAVDYGRVTPQMRGLRTAAAPFLTWFAQSAPNWMRYARTNPAKFTGKFVAPAAMLWFWNNGYVPGHEDIGEIEKRNPDYLKALPFHINTGYQTTDQETGKKKDLVLSLRFGLDVALNLVGMDRIGPALTAWKAGKLKPMAAIDQMLTEAGQKPWRFATKIASQPFVHGWNLARQQVPVLQILEGLHTNRDPMTKEEIVPSVVKDAEQARFYQARYIAQRIIPIFSVGHMAAMRGMEEPQSKAAYWLDKHGPAGELGAAVVEGVLAGPLDWKRALGVRELDPERQELLQERIAVAEAERSRVTWLYDLEQAWIQSEAGDDPEAFDRELDRMLDSEDAPVSSDDILSRLRSPRVRLNEAIERQRQATTPEERAAARQEVDELRGVSLLESIRRSPKTARAFAE